MSGEFLKKQFFCLLVILLLSDVCFSQNKTVDSLNGILRNNPAESIRIDALSNLIYNLIIIGQLEKAGEQLTILENLGKKTKNRIIEAKTLNYKGLIFFYKGNSEQAKFNCRKALALFREEKDDGGLARAGNNLAMIHLRENEYYNALEYMSESLKYFEKINDKNKLLVLYNNIGNLQAQLGNSEQSFKYFSLALQLALELNEKKISPYIYNSLGNYYGTQQKYKEALANYKKSINISEEERNQLVLGLAWFNMAIIYQAQRDYDNSIKYMQKSLEVRKSTGDSIGIIASLNQLGLFNLVINDFDKSKENLNNALKLNKLKRNNSELKQSYLYYSKLDSAQGNYSEAYDLYKKYSEINESMLIESKSREIGRLETKYEYELKEEQLAAFRKEKDLENNNRIIKQNYLIYSLAGAFLLMAVILAFAFIAKINKQKVNETLIKMVDKKTNELRTAKEKAEASEKMKEDFLSQMSHEIRTPLSSVISLAGVLNNEIKKLSEKEILDIVKGISKSGNRIIRTVEMILNYAEVTNGTYTPKKDRIELAKICNEVITEVKPLVNEIGLAIKLNDYIGEKIVEVDEYSIKQVIKNIVENAVIYTEEGSINITLEETEGKIVFNCRDTGIGMSDEYKVKIFEPFCQEEMGYTRKYDGNGLGLALAKKYCDLNNASIVYESEKGSGSLFKVTFN